MLSEVCKDTKIKPKLTPLTGEELDSRTANTMNEARPDIRARGAWEREQQAFLDLRFLTQHSPLSQKVVATVSRNERTRKEKSIQ